MESMEDKLEELIQSKTWHELTEDEKQFVLETLGSKATFEAFKKTDLAISGLAKAEIVPGPKVLPSLKRKFSNVHQHEQLLDRIVFFRIPAYAVAAIVAITILITWHSKQSPSVVQVAATQIAQRDTVFLPSPPDTVFVPKVIYRYKDHATKTPLITVVKNTDRTETTSGVGVNMKEKEELDNLLVSGSE
jgi:hypothetical protein